MATDWYVFRESGPLGPLTAADLRRMAADGSLLPASLVSVDRKVWKESRAVRGLEFPANPPEGMFPTAEATATSFPGTASTLASPPSPNAFHQVWRALQFLGILFILVVIVRNVWPKDNRLDQAVKTGIRYEFRKGARSERFVLLHNDVRLGEAAITFTNCKANVTVATKSGRGSRLSLDSESDLWRFGTDIQVPFPPIDGLDGPVEIIVVELRGLAVEPKREFHYSSTFDVARGVENAVP